MSALLQEVVVLSANQYNVVDRTTGEINRGTTVRYALSDNLSPCVDGNLKGYKLSKASLDYEAFNNFGDVPAVYTVELNFNVSSDGTTKITAGNFAFKRALFQNGKKEG